MKRKTRLILRCVSLLFTLAICVTAFIYSDKDMEQSNSESKAVTGAVASVAVTNYEKLSDEGKAASELALNVRIRKIAHCLEYMAMGAGAAVFALTFLPESVEEEDKKRAPGGKRGKRRPGAAALCGMALAFCLMHAVFDEVHQYFVPGRAGTALDAALDFLAASVSVLILWGVVQSQSKPSE